MNVSSRRGDASEDGQAPLLGAGADSTQAPRIKVLAPCPGCGYRDAHTGTCPWSVMRSGKVWRFWIEAEGVPL